MRRFFFLPLILVSSCELVDITPQTNPYVNAKNIPSATAVMFNEGYNWRKDSLGADASVRLGLFKEKTLVMEISDSGSFKGCSDALRHRLHGGKLYTFCEGGDGMCNVACNAGTLFSFQSCGTLDGVEFTDSCIYTLEKDSKNKMWTLRKDGIVAAQEENSDIISGLFNDGGDVSFSYTKKLQSTGSREFCKYYIWHRDVAEQVQFDFQVDTLYDMKYISGAIHCLVRSSALDGCIWLEDDKEAIIDLSSADVRPSFLTMEKTGGRAVCYGVVESGGVTRDFVWERDRILFATDGDMRISSLCRNAGTFCAMCSRKAAGTDLRLVTGSGFRPVASRYAFISPYALAYSPDGAGYALNDMADGFSPVIVNGCDTLRYNFNGFFTYLDLP